MSLLTSITLVGIPSRGPDCAGGPRIHSLAISGRRQHAICSTIAGYGGTQSSCKRFWRLGSRRLDGRDLLRVLAGAPAEEVLATCVARYQAVVNPSTSPFFPACEFRACWVWPLRLLFVCAGRKDYGSDPLVFAGATTAENKKRLHVVIPFRSCCLLQKSTSVLTLGPPSAAIVRLGLWSSTGPTSSSGGPRAGPSSARPPRLLGGKGPPRLAAVGRRRTEPAAKEARPPRRQRGAAAARPDLKRRGPSKTPPRG